MSRDKIRLRPLQVTPDSHDGEEWLRLHDRAGITPDVEIARHLGAILARFDGSHNFDEILEILRLEGHQISREWLQEFIDELDELLLLDSPQFQAREAEMESQFTPETVRKAAFAGRSYSENSAELRIYLEEKLARGVKRLPPIAYDLESVRGIVTPHIDFHRGGHVEAASYLPLLTQVEVSGRPFDTLVILGIAHDGISYPFCASPQDFATPFGVAHCDRDFIADLRAIIGPQLTREQNAHENEHSIEFSAVFCQMFDELKPSKIVPILCGGFWESLRQGEAPEAAEPDVAVFIDALREITRKHEDAGKKIGFIASVDGAHVGTQFGDDTRITPEILKAIGDDDAAWISAVETGEKARFHAHFSKNGNARNVDAHPALYTLMAAFPHLRAQKLDYDQAFSAGANIVVSFASLALFEA